MSHNVQECEECGITTRGELCRRCSDDGTQTFAEAYKQAAEFKAEE